MNAAQGVFGTKAETLAKLSGRLKTATILPQVTFTAKRWIDEPDAILGRLRENGWLSRPMAVRSSAQSEDGEIESMAGRFESVLNVRGEREFCVATDKVIASYGTHDPEDQVLVQPMLTGVSASGVAFTRDPSTGSAYFVINYDDATRSTASVTGGGGGALRTCYLYPLSSRSIVPRNLAPVVGMLRELDQLTEGTALDVEFAQVGDEIFLLQARPLTGCRLPRHDDLDVLQALDQIAVRFEELSKPHPFLFGRRSLFGVMPDWNPAEIIGIRPRPLALSLYRELVTDSIWAYQRDNYGYRNLRSFPLLVDFHGLPYIDVRVSFNSFIPDGLDPKLSARLVDYYLDCLASEPANHDKVEFEIIFTCYTLDLPERIERLKDQGFSDSDCSNLTEALRELTNHIINRTEGLWRKDVGRIAQLEDRYDTLILSDLGTIEKLYWLLEDCKRYGTLPFAGLARAGFIAMQLLDSLVSVGILSVEDRGRFLRSLTTVGSRMTSDFQNLSQAEFLSDYGHLRPGTYDLLSPRYDAAPERYFDFAAETGSPSAATPFQLTLEQLRETQQFLQDHQLDHDALSFFDFIRSAIEGREQAKFVFTRSLSKVLELFRELGEENGLSAEDCSLCSIDVIQRLYSSSRSVEDELHRSLAEGQKRFALTRQLILPQLIESVSDIYGFEQATDRPNFVTQGRVTAKAVSLGQSDAAPSPGSLRGAIILIPSADPGYDWIFSHEIVGFVTMYGGVNSHMAIRAAELDVPAVIGAGEQFFSAWSAASVLELDCVGQQVRVVR